ncbi:protein diaphanous homolog 3-like isoform X1 [Dicentrarchus labrax]|uniref:protein diaphanous homolog 3-like isoform X1 n=1 Tax=Dicentrarchus labrax TaxID=13489 RepID=UPI0021F5E2B0|nr:protein diaphanous homolog 3-like isoform X1 [Dicentrarchus labrax]
MDSYSQRLESTTGRDSKSQKKKGSSHHSTSCYDEGERKPKFHLPFRNITDDVLDRFASIRIPGSKKERPPLSHSKHNTNDWSISSSSTSHQFEELSSKITSEKEILALFEKMMEDMNLSEEKKTPLRDKDLNTKREMVIQYIFTASKTGSLRSSHQISPQEFLGELKSGVMDERLFACLDSLRVSLTSNPVSWVQSFGHEGLGLLLDILERLLFKKQEKIDKRNQHKVVQCLKAFMNNKYGLDRILGEEKSLALLARAIDPTQSAMMTDVVKLLSAICIVGEENTLEKVLEAITTAGEWRAIERFSPIVQGLQDRSVQLQVACMQLINALVTSPDELDFRLHIRNEFMRCGLKEILPQLTTIRNDALDIQLKVFEEHKEEDMIEFSHRLEDIKSELDDAGDVFSIVQSMVKDSNAEPYFLSILQHLMLIRNDYLIRPQYFKIIEECVSQIVLHRSGTDPDFSYRKRLDVDFSHLLEVCVDKARTDEYEQRASELAQKFDEEFLSRQEAQTQLVKCEEKIAELQAELQAFRSQFGAVPVGLSSAHVGQSLPSGPLPPAPAPGVPAPPPPPPPPPLPGCPAPPPPPGVPPPFGAPPPPPLGFGGALGSPTHHSLPYGLRPKKDFKPETSMKRLNWSKIRPQEMSESCFWVRADEDQYAKPELLSRVALTFCSQRTAKKEEEDLEDKKSIKKRIKELKVLDPKIAQNLSIFLGSFRMPYQEIRRMIVEVDEEQLTEPMIQNLVKHLPEQEQLNALAKYKNEYANLSEPEQFGVVMSSVKRLRPRLSHILFRLQFEEQINNLRPDILAVNAACDEVRKSRSFGRLLELVLLLGNYMNAGSRNAQTYGFDLSSLCKLKDTKSADQKTTLLHFLAQVCEEEFPNVIKFVEDLEHVDRASRVSAENLEKSLRQMERQLLQLERDLETFSSPDDPNDMFFTKMASFSKVAREQYGKLVIMHSNMETLYQNMLEYFAVDPKKTSVEELFTDLSNFRSMFTQALKENLKRRESEEKQRRARAAKEKAEREKQERQQKKRRLLEVNTENDETGVMDSLLEALQSGAAFRDRRKRAPRPRDNQQQTISPSSFRQVLRPVNHALHVDEFNVNCNGGRQYSFNSPGKKKTENNKAPLQRSRSRQNINAGSAVVKAPPAKEAHNESEGHPSAARSKAAACTESGRRHRNPPGHSYWLDRERVVEREMVKPTEKEMEVEAEPPAFQPTSTVAAVSSCSTNGESDVEALLAKLRAL